MKRTDRNTAEPHDESPAPDIGEPAPGASAAAFGPASSNAAPGGRSTRSTSSAPSESGGRTRRKPFVLRAAGAAMPGATVSAGSRLVRVFQNIGPYLMIEILLPGGTLLALLLYASRNGRPFREDAPGLATLVALATTAARALVRWMPLDALRLAREKPAERDGLEPLGLVPG